MMLINRLIPHFQLEQAYFPSLIIINIINEMRNHFAPAQNLTTRAFCLSEFTCIQISLKEGDN
jgi:hypothetical protein